MEKTDFGITVAALQQGDWVRRLPNRHLEEDAAGGDLLYMIDSGLQQRLLFRALPSRLPDRFRGKSWEGFGIDALQAAAGPLASFSYWASSEGEIDLVIDWGAGGAPWAIEFKTGEHKPPSPGFYRGLEKIGPEAAFVVDGGDGVRFCPNHTRKSLRRAMEELRERAQGQPVG